MTRKYGHGGKAVVEPQSEVECPPCVDENPDPSSSVCTGVYERTDDGVVSYVTLEAGDNAREGYEAKGFVFKGFTPLTPTAAPEHEFAINEDGLPNLLA